mmetsp:Transcript_22268/g.57051  ORF Transcript_22268/g.57051 Transcript_22268/m.57051 type:complete len:242 (+) Transcript_22268:386-1111(+)
MLGVGVRDGGNEACIEAGLRLPPLLDSVVDGRRAQRRHKVLLAGAAGGVYRSAGVDGELYGQLPHGGGAAEDDDLVACLQGVVVEQAFIGCLADQAQRRRGLPAQLCRLGHDARGRHRDVLREGSGDGAALSVVGVVAPAAGAVAPLNAADLGAWRQTTHAGAHLKDGAGEVVADAPRKLAGFGPQVLDDAAHDEAVDGVERGCGDLDDDVAVTGLGDGLVLHNDLGPVVAVLQGEGGLHR